MSDYPHPFGPQWIPDRYISEAWKGIRSPYGLPIPLAYGVTWVDGIQVYSGPQLNWHNGTATRTAAGTIYVIYFDQDETTGELTVGEDRGTVQSAVLVLCERATALLDILKDGVSINSGNIDGVPITTTAMRLKAISGRVPQIAGLMPPTGQDAGYFHGGTGSATAHTRFAQASSSTAPYTYSSIARLDLCALHIGSSGSRPKLKFKVQGELAASSSLGADPVDVLVDLWARAGMASTLDVTTYYQAYCDSGGGSTTDQWVVNRCIDSQTSARDLIDSLLFETFSTAVTLEDGSVQIVPRDSGDVTATALGEDDFVISEGSDPVTCERKQAADCFNCFPVKYKVTTDSGTHEITNEDTTFAAANPSPYGISGIHRASPVSCSWVSTAEHALNLSHLLAQESFTVRRTFKFKLHPRWVLLQVGDTISLTESHLGLSSQAARIVSLSEDESGVIEVEAQEWFGQVAYTTPAVDPTDGFSSTIPGLPPAVDNPSSDSVISAGGEKRDVWSAYRQLRAAYEGTYNAIADHLANTWIAGYDTGTDGAVCNYTVDLVTRDYMTLRLGNVNHEPTDTAWWRDLGTDLVPKRGAFYTAITDLTNYMISLGAGSTEADLLDEAHIAAWAAVDTPIVPADFRAYFGAAQDADAAFSDALTLFQQKVSAASTPILLTGSSANFLRGDGAWGSSIYDLVVYASDKPDGSMILGRWAIAHSIDFPADFAGSNVSAGVAATASTVLTVKKNGTSVGTLTFAASGTIPTMDCTAWSVAADDIVTIENQSSADASLAQISITLSGLRTS